MTTCDQAVSTFVQWIKEQGGTLNKVTLAQGELGQGGFASEAIAADEVFASIPFDVVITEHVARARYPQLSAHSARAVLAWYVAREKALGAASVHAAYLATLPDHIKTPYFFDASELVYLNHTNLGTAVRERAPGIRSDYDGALRLVDEADRVEWEQYLWAFCMLSSRSFPYTLMDPDYDGPSTEIMLPLLDVFNHKPATKITWSRQGTIADGGRIAFVAGDPIQQGEQVFNNYGPKSNEELLLGYGFCLPGNEHDYISLKPNISCDPNSALKQQILAQCGVSSGNADPLVHYIHRDHVPVPFLKSMRVFVMNEMELEQYAACADASQLDWISFRNELVMLMVTASLLQARIYDLHKEMLPRDNLTLTQQYALMYRDGQRDLYYGAKDMLDARKQQVIYALKQVLDGGDMPLYSDGVPPLDVRPPALADNPPFTTLESTVMTVSSLLQHDAPFKAFIDFVFEDIEKEIDVVMMLCLVRQLTVQSAPWATFLQPLRAQWTMEHADEETVQDLQELYDGLFPQSFAHMKGVATDVFTLENLVWASDMIRCHAVESSSLDEWPSLLLVFL